MPQSLVKIYVHIVFSTKDRINLITPEIESELFKYISGIITGNGGRLIIANGTANHIHLLISIGRLDIGELIGHIKRDSSLWVKKRFPQNSKFYWQRGYGARGFYLKTLMWLFFYETRKSLKGKVMCLIL